MARGSGNRTYYHDASYTPVVDLGVSNTHVFAALDNGTGGSVRRMSRDLGTVDVSNFYTGNPRVRAVTVSADETRAMVIDRLTTTTSNVKIWDAGTWQAPIPFNDAGAPTTPYVAYDVHYQEGLASFVVAHGRYYSRYSANSPYTRLQGPINYRTVAPTSVRLTSLGTGTSQLLFAGRNEGTIGGVEKMDYKLVRPSPNGWWPASGTEPSVKDVAAAGNHVMFCSTSPTGDFFVRLRALDLWALGYRSTTAPRSVGLTIDSIAFLANGPGVARSSKSDLTGQFLRSPDAGWVTFSDDSLSAAPLHLTLDASPNPARAVTTIMFTLPAEGVVDLGLFDVAGRRIARLQNGALPSGRYSFEWKPRTTGVYFATLSAGGLVLRRKIVVL